MARVTDEWQSEDNILLEAPYPSARNWPLDVLPISWKRGGMSSTV